MPEVLGMKKYIKLENTKLVDKIETYLLIYNNNIGDLKVSKQSALWINSVSFLYLHTIKKLNLPGNPNEIFAIKIMIYFFSMISFRRTLKLKGKKANMFSTN